MALNDFDSTFASNPIVKAIGDQLGLGPLFANAGATPQVKPGASRPSVAESRFLPSAQLRLMRMQQMNEMRQNTPGARAQSAGMGMPGGMGEVPMMSEDTLHDPGVQEMLKGYGVDPNVQVDPHLFLHNPAAWANHPVLSGLLEGGLSGLAFTNGGNTVGESLSNIARGMMASDSAHAERVNSQLMMPFQQAQTVAQLRALGQEQQLREAQIKEAKQRGDYYAAAANFKDTQPPMQPIWQAQQAVLDAYGTGDKDKIKSALDAYHSIEGELHPPRTFAPPTFLNQLGSDAYNKAKQDLIDQYSPVNHDWNDVPFDAVEKLHQQFLSDQQLTHPPKTPTGKTDAQNEVLRKSLIDQANAKIDAVVGQLRTAGSGYIYQGAPIPGLKTTNGVVTAQALADFKNRTVSDLNVELARAKLDPITAVYTAEGTVPGRQNPVAPAGTGQNSPKNPPMPKIEQPLAPPRPSEQALTPPASILKPGVINKVQGPHGRVEKWILDRSGRPVQLPDDATGAGQ